MSEDQAQVARTGTGNRATDGAPAFTRNRSRRDDVRAHLSACSPGFIPPLATRVAIPDYAAKLVARAERFEAWRGTDLIGLVAVYCDDANCVSAFVTSVSVVPQHGRAGIGRRLMEQAIAHVRGLGFESLSLRVDRNAVALGLYRTLGFVLDGPIDDELRLSLALRSE